MPSAKATVDINLSPDELWQVIGGFGSLPDWISNVCQSRLADGGRVRYLHDQIGRTFVEKLERYDAAARSYSYSIVESPVGVSDYLATIAVTGINGGRASHVEWSTRFTPAGISEQEARETFEGIFSTGLKELASRYNGEV